MKKECQRFGKKWRVALQSANPTLRPFGGFVQLCRSQNAKYCARLTPIPPYLRSFARLFLLRFCSIAVSLRLCTDRWPCALLVFHAHTPCHRHSERALTGRITCSPSHPPRLYATLKKSFVWIVFHEISAVRVRFHVRHRYG